LDNALRACQTRTACASARISPSTDLRFPPYGRDPGGCRPWGADADTGLLPVHPHELLYQLIFGFHPMDGIPEDAVHGAQTLMQVLQLLPVHPHELLHPLIFGFQPMDGIPEDAVPVEQTLMQVLLLLLLPVHPHELFHQLIFGFHVGGIPDDAIDRADADAGRLLIVADAFGAAIRVYLVDLAPQGDGLVRTLRIAHVTVDALVGDEQCHLRPPSEVDGYPRARRGYAAGCRNSRRSPWEPARKPHGRCPARCR